MELKIKLKALRSSISGLLKWSDRIGSDEIYELEKMLKIIDEAE